MMEVDIGVHSWTTDAPHTLSNEADKFVPMKEFVAAAREFHSTHSDSSVSMMSRNLGLIVSTCDLSIFTPGRTEVCSFFSTLWQVMNDPRAPHWAGVAALSRAAKEPSARYALTHTYKFLPILARLLSDSISLEKKMRLLCLMQDISYGTKIGWQEDYLPGLLKQLSDWVLTSSSSCSLGRCALSVLVNICQGNLPAMHAFQRTVDTKQFITKLLNMKDDGYGGVEVCRLLLCLSAIGRSAFSSQQHVHSFLACAMTTLIRAVSERDPAQLLHVYMFLNDLCSDAHSKLKVVTYPHFTSPVSDVIKSALVLCRTEDAEGAQPDLEPECLEHVLNCLTLLIRLELFSLRALHPKLMELSMRAMRLSLAPALHLMCSVLAQYKEDSRLPHELMQMVSEGLPALLVPPALEPGKAGEPWLNFVCVLCDFPDLIDRLLSNLTARVFEETFFTVLFHLQQNGAVGVAESSRAVVVGCRAALSLAPHSRDWDAALARLLAHHQVCKVLSDCLSTAGSPRKQVLQLVKHPHFPPDKITPVFSHGEGTRAPAALAECGRGEGVCEAVGGAREAAVDALIDKISRALQRQQIGDISTSSIMDLYENKMCYLNMRLNSHLAALKAAAEHTASLQHSLATLQATGATQQELLYTTQLHHERQKELSDRLSVQLEDAEKSVRGFRAKLAAERLDKDNQMSALKNAQRAHVATLESEIKTREKDLSEKENAIQQLQAEVKSLTTKLQQQSTKNSELAGVLVKFEERVKARDRKLEEAAAGETALRRDLDHREQMVKQLEKTVSERENRLYQVTAQLEEMKRVQDMVAKLMSSGKAASS